MTTNPSGQASDELIRASEAARLLDVAYRLPSEKPPTDLLHWVAPAAAEAAVFADPEHPDGVLVAIRGTEGWADWWRDFDAKMTPAFDGLPGHVHRGFDVHARLLLQELRIVLKPYDRITLAGHSLGAASLPPIARDLANHGFPVKELWGFGMPRVGDKRYGQGFDRWLLGAGIFARRVVAIGRGGRQDLVTRIPLSRHGWWHVMPPLILGSDGQVYRTAVSWERFRREQPFGARSRLMSWLLQWAVLTRLRWAIGAHNMAHYLKALDRAIRRGGPPPSA